MRLAALLICLSTPAFGWQSSFSGSVCLLTHETEEAEVVVRHDPRQTLPYAIQIRRTASVWQAAPLFSIRFDGPGELTISSDRYRLSGDGAVLEVADKAKAYKRGVDTWRTRAAMLERLSQRMRFEVWREGCLQDDHAFDAVICAYTAYLWARDGWQLPEENREVFAEDGWIWFPAAEENPKR